MTVTFEVTYKSPDDASGNFVPSFLNSTMHQQLQQQYQSEHSSQPPQHEYSRMGGGGGGGGVASTSAAAACSPSKADADDDDKQMLLNIEQNIVNFERSLGKGGCLWRTGGVGGFGAFIVGSM